MAGTVNSAGRPGGVGNRGQTNRDKINDRTGGAGAGTRAVIGDAPSITRGPVSLPTGPNITNRPGRQAPATPDRNATVDGKGNLSTQSLGGTTTQDEYTPGAVENHPYANPAAIADMLSSAIPMGGLTNTAYKGAKSLADGSDPLSASNMGPIGDAFGGDPGPMRGYQPDRYRGAASLGGIGGSGGAVNDGSQREIAGQRFSSDFTALVGDPDLLPTPEESDAFHDDIVLQDRRKPYSPQSMSQLLAQLRS